MAEFDSNEKESMALYKLMIGSIVPRPIAWVSTIDAEGLPNLAPYSFFNGVAFNPPTIAFSAIDRNGEKKDTARNIDQHPEFTVHMVSDSLAEAMNVTCTEFGAHVNEFSEAGLTAVPGSRIGVPRVAEAQIAMECRLVHHLRIGNAPNTSSHILGEVVHWHIADDVLQENGRIDADALRAIGRMGGTEYARTADRFAIERPVVADEDPRSLASYQALLAKAAPRPQ